MEHEDDLRCTCSETQLATMEKNDTRSVWVSPTQCAHGDHVSLCDGIAISRKYPDEKHPSHRWKRICGSVAALLRTTPVRFEHGAGCLSSLITEAKGIRFPTIPEILSVESRSGVTDYYIAHKLFGAKVVHLTDVKPSNDLVEALSCRDAVLRYKGASGLMFTYPSVMSDEYEGLIARFRGDYIIYTGDLRFTGHATPTELLKQITWCFTELIRVSFAGWCGTSHPGHLVLYTRRKLH